MKEKFIKLGLEVLGSVEELSTCYKTKVGAVLFKEERILAIGYNGTPPNWAHCEDDNSLHKIFEVHAEANLIAFCAKHGISTLGTTMFVTYTPCAECAKLLVQAGVTEVFCKRIYANDVIGIEILKSSGIKLSVLAE